MVATDSERPLLTHLVELRSRLLKVVAAVGVVFLVLFPFANTLYRFLASPLLAQLPQDSSMVAIDVASPFIAPFKLTLLLAIVIAMPLILYQLWAFVAPGLYRREKLLAVPLMISSTCLFYTGMIFAYYIVFPLMFTFFTSVAPEGVAVMTDINRYLDFVIKLFIAFGVAFEVPVVTLLLVMSGSTTPADLKRKRPYVIVGAFVVGMVFTPPDIISQVLLAIPVWLLFELGLLMTRFVTPFPQQVAKIIEDEKSA